MLGIQLQRKRESGSVVVMMFGEFFRAVGTGQESKTAIFGSRVIKGDPDGACRERSDRPVLAILMPWRLAPDFRWFREEARIP